MPRLLLLILAILYIAGAPRVIGAETTAGQSLITATDLFKVKQIESPALSPDGRWVVYVVRSAEREAGEAWVYCSHLWLAATDGKTPPRQLATGSADDTNPVWSPDGERLAFVRRAKGRKPQIFLLFPLGGEAQPLTKLEAGATRPRWSPDGTRILFASPLSELQRREAPGLPEAKTEQATLASPDGTPQEIREWLARNGADGIPRVSTQLSRAPDGGSEAGPPFSEFYTIEARDGAEPTCVAIDHKGCESAAWLADGKSIVCLGPRQTSDDPFRHHFNSLYRIDLARGHASVLLDEAGCNYAEPSPSPDGKWIAYTVTTGGEYSFDQAMVADVPTNGGKPEILTGQLDRTATNLKWSPDSAEVYFVAADRGRIPLYRVNRAYKEVQTLTAEPAWGVRDFAIGSHALVQVVTNPGNPWELYLTTVDGKSAQPLTAHNRGWLKERKLSAPEPHRLVNKDGVTVDYWTLKPTALDPAGKYPLLVDIHGGPAVMWGPGEASAWFELQYYAARGYSVMICNPRGSSGYGRDFLHANFQDWGIGPASDVLVAAGFAAREASVDRNRQVLTGAGYGGYLAAWIIGHDHRFKAAFVQRGVFDLRTFFGEAHARTLFPLYWGGFPWQQDVRYLLDRDSPLTYVANIATPLLLEQSNQGSPARAVQSQVLYHSLRQLGREVEYLRYPPARHDNCFESDPTQDVDRLVRSNEFFRRFIGDN